MTYWLIPPVIYFVALVVAYIIVTQGDKNHD